MAEAAIALGVMGLTIWALFGNDLQSGTSSRTSTLYSEPLDHSTSRSLPAKSTTRVERTV